MAEGGEAVGEQLPNLQKRKLRLFHSTKLFHFAKEQVETIRTRLREELRPSYAYGVTMYLKVLKRRRSR